MKNIIYLLLLVSTQLISQPLPVGNWRSHGQFSNLKQLIDIDNTVIGITENHVFAIDKNTKEIDIWSKVTTLNDVGITSITQLKANNSIFIGYKNGNLDIIQDGVTSNLPLLKDATLEGAKEILNIHLSNNLAYLTTPIGVFVLDYQKEELVEGFREIGIAGAPVTIRESVFVKDSLYLLTTNGLRAAPLDSRLNLQDFNNWITIQTPSVNQILGFNEQLYATGQDILFTRQGGTWDTVFVSTALIDRLTVSNNKLIAVSKNGFMTIEDKDFVPQAHYSINDIAFVNNETWVADSEQGLVILEGSNSSSPLRNFISLDSINNISIANSNVYAISHISNAISVLKDGFWSTIDTDSSVTAIVYSPAQNTTYAAVEGIGIYDLDNKAIVSSPLDLAFRITAMAFDREGSLWVSQFGTENALSKRNPQGEWSTFSFAQAAASNIKEFHIDDFGQIWAELDQNFTSGLFVYDPVNDRSSWVRASNSTLPSGTILDIAVDLNSEIWLATASGVSFLPFAPDVFATSAKFLQPVFGNRLLFEDEPISGIAVDGGNRKWVTTNDGAWLLEDNGDELVVNFTVENSPLPTNDIRSIDIHPYTGEVYLLTNRGLMSYRSDASQGTREHAQTLEVFPNPVPPNFNGQVGIYGTAINATLKITDISGNFIRELESQGGSTSWNLLDYNNIKVETGVYLIFSSTRDGSDTLVGKMAVIN